MFNEQHRLFKSYEMGMQGSYCMDSEISAENVIWSTYRLVRFTFLILQLCRRWF